MPGKRCPVNDFLDLYITFPQKSSRLFLIGYRKMRVSSLCIKRRLDLLFFRGASLPWSALIRRAPAGRLVGKARCARL